MNKYIVLILTVKVIFVDSKDVTTCLHKLARKSFLETKSGIQVFLIAYYIITTQYKECVYLSEYVDEIFTSVTDGYRDDMLLSPADWCNEYQANEDLMEGGYTIKVKDVDTEFSTSIQAFTHSYYNTCFDSVKRKNNATQNYYEYILETYKPILLKKRIPNPVEYCTGQPAKGLPSDYAGLYKDHTNSNEDMNVQDKGQKDNSEEKTSRLLNVILDNEGHEIDLNNAYYYEADNDKDKNKNQV